MASRSTSVVRPTAADIPVSTPGRRPSRRPTLGEAAALDAGVRQAAIQVFLDHGYDGTTMDAVARTAGITRRTLYARYADKAAMFNDVVHEALMYAGHDVAPTIDRNDLRGSLLAIARSAYARAVDERTVRLGLLVMRESARFPNLVPKEHHLVRLPHMQAIIELLKHHTEAGSVAISDCEMAAEQFLTIVASHPARLASFGLRRSAEHCDAYLTHAVDLFLHGVHAEGTLADHES